MRMTPNLKLVEGLPSRKHPLYNTFSSMKDRCNNPNCKSYPDYGGRGIIVCQRWKDSFADFVADMGIKLDKTLSIDRIDNDGNYEVVNCRWSVGDRKGWQFAFYIPSTSEMYTRCNPF